MDGSYEDYFSEVGIKLRDLEEKANLLKERTILIGQNLIELKEKWGADISQLKADMEILKEENKRLKKVLEMIAEQLDNIPKREEIEILRKQFKMFEPLNLVRMSDLDKILKEKKDKWRKI
ncbi:hypothetical protein HYV49_03005 [Candidatus Pacearchaeota archaeon]|nr:hypothetical protein [Candidatus Pacearchaeota archaeon]